MSAAVLRRSSAVLRRQGWRRPVSGGSRPALLEPDRPAWHQAGVKALTLAALVEHGQVVVGAVLIHAAYTAQCAFGQALGFEEDGLVLWLRFGHKGHDHSHAAHLLGAQFNAYWRVEGLAALGGEVGAEFVGLGDSFHLVAGE